MENIYENIYIGHFIFACGRISGQQGMSQYESVNLLQQTPCDKLLGDLMMSEGARSLLIEFKRSAADLVTEKNKPLREKLISTLQQPEQASMLEISRKVHFLGFPYAHQLYFTGYMEFFHREDPEPLSMYSIIKRFYSGEIVYDEYDNHSEVFAGAAYPEFNAYIKYMVELDPAPKPGGIGGLVLVTNEKREDMFIPFETIEDLPRIMEAPIPEIISVRPEEVKQKIAEAQEKIKTAPIQLRAGG